MAVTDAERHQLYEVLKSHLGAASADTLMNLIPPAGWADLATKADHSTEVAELRGEMTAGFAEVRTEIAEVRGELKAEISGLRGELKAEISGLRGEMKAEIGGLRSEMVTHIEAVRSDMTRTFGTWLFASQAGVIAAVAVLFAVLR